MSRYRYAVILPPFCLMAFLALADNVPNPGAWKNNYSFVEDLDQDGTACTAGANGQAYIQTLAVGVTSIHCCEPNAGDADGTTEIWFDCTPVGSGTPGGSTTQVQYNNAGAFGGDQGLIYTSATDYITLDADGTATSGSGVRFCGKSGTACAYGGTAVPNMLWIADNQDLTVAMDDSACDGICGPSTIKFSHGTGLVFGGGAGITGLSSLNVTGSLTAGTTVITNSGANQGTWQAPASGGAKIYTGPAATATLASLGLTETFSGAKSFDLDLTHAANKGGVWNFTNPFTGVNRILLDSSNTFNGTINHVARICNNCNANGTKAVATSPLEAFDFELTYDDTNDGTLNYWTELNWDLETASGHPLGSVTYRPLALAANAFHNPPDATFGWISKRGQDYNADGTLGSPYGDYSFYLGTTGAAVFGGSTVSSGQLNVDGSGILGLGGTTGGTIIGEGVTVNNIRTNIGFNEPTGSTGSINVPNTKGVTMLFVGATNQGTSWVVIAGNGAAAESNIGNEACALSDLVCDATYDFGSATEFSCTADHAFGIDHVSTGSAHKFMALCRKA